MSARRSWVAMVSAGAALWLMLGLSAVQPTTAPSLRESQPTVAATPDDQPEACLVVDLSGSLVGYTSEGLRPERATDPDGYTASVINLFGDLNVGGRLVLITFTTDDTGREERIPLRAFDLRQPEQRKSLRALVTDLDDRFINRKVTGNTPTAHAIEKLHRYYSDTKAPEGASCVLVTDGEPTGAPPLDTEGQYQLIANDLVPRFVQRSWKVHSLALGRGRWLDRFKETFTRTGGDYRRADTAEDLMSLGLFFFSKLCDGCQEPRNLTATLGPDGTALVPLELEPGASEFTVLVTKARGNAAALYEQDRQVSCSDPRVIACNADDKHYVLMRLKADGVGPGGAGRWSLKVSGPVGNVVRVAVGYRSSLTIQLSRPTERSVPVGKDVLVCGQWISGGVPTSVAGAVELELTSEAGAQSTVKLQENLRTASASPGEFCGTSTFASGLSAIRLQGVSADGRKASTSSSVFADVVPTLEPLTKQPSLHVRDGERVRFEAAQITWGDRTMPPEYLRQLMLRARARAAEARDTQERHDPSADLDSDLILSVHFPVELTDTARSGLLRNQELRVTYDLSVDATWEFHGRRYADPGLPLAPATIFVRPWPPPCYSLDRGLWRVCGLVLESPALLPAVIAGLALTVLTIVVLRRRETEDRVYADSVEQRDTARPF